MAVGAEQGSTSVYANRTASSTARRPITTAIALVALVLILAQVVAAADDRPGPVLVVRSGNLPQYDEAVASFAAAVDAPLVDIEIGESRERGTRRLVDAAAGHHPRAVYALGARAAYLSRRMLPEIPVVFAMVLGWQRYGLDSGPVTGVALEIPVDSLFTRLKLMLPHVKSLGLIHGDGTDAELVERARTAASVLGMTLVEEHVNADDEVPGAYRRMRRNIDALWMLADPVVVTRDNFTYLARRTRADGIAFIGFSENFVRAGAVVSVSPSYATMGTQAAILMERLLADPSAAPPVQTPVAANLIVNADTIVALGLDLDAATIGMADVVVSMASNSPVASGSGNDEEAYDAR
jgi:putative ABC transport system substrate-binding protein